MLGDGLANSGQKGSYFRYQYASLKLLSEILAGITAIPGQDFETRTTTYTATAAGPGYAIGDIIVRYDIINVSTGAVVSTLWFNQTTQTVIIPAPAPANLSPVSAPTSVTVINGPGGAAVNIQDGGNSITIDALALDVALSTRASEATLLTRASEATLLAVSATLTALNAKFNSLGQKTMAGSAPVVLASDQTAIPVTQGTSPWVVSGSVASADDHNYGVVGAATLRTAAQIGNATGAAAFNAGTTNAQTLRVVLPTDQTVIPVALPTGAEVLTSTVDTTGAGSPVAAGAKSIGFTTNSTFTGTINGVARDPSTFYGFDAETGKTLPAIAYTVTAGSITIDKLV